eukprot:969893-Amphidinium_carterae.1
MPTHWRIVTDSASKRMNYGESTLCGVLPCPNSVPLPAHMDSFLHLVLLLVWKPQTKSRADTGRSRMRTLVCAKCGKPCAFTLTTCNSCGASLKDCAQSDVQTNVMHLQEWHKLSSQKSSS